MQLNVLQKKKRNIHSDRQIKNQSQEEINYKEISPRAQLTKQKAPSRADMSWHWADWCTTLSLWTIIMSTAYYLSSSWLTVIRRGWRDAGIHNRMSVKHTHFHINFPSVSPPFIQSVERLQRISSNDNVVTANSVQIALFVHQTFLRGRAALRSE